MTTAAKTTFGNKLFASPALTAPTTAIAELLSFDPPTMTRATIDATTHDSAGGAEEKIAEGTYSPGDLKGQVHYIAGSIGDQAMIAAMTGGALQNVKMHVKTASGFEAVTFSAYLTSYGPDGMSVKGKQTAAFSFEVTGAATHAAVP